MAAYKIYRRKKNLGGFQIFFSQKLQGYTSYKCYAGILLEIFQNGPKVARLRKLRCTNKYFFKVARLWKLQGCARHHSVIF